MFGRIAILFIYFYRLFVSPFLGNVCRHYPSCSVYALKAFKSNSFCKAIYLVLCRICTCHPFCPPKFDKN